ncbi:MAG: transporter substrate-binding domain-containing protein [Cyanobacteria bacterium J06598_3]
MKRRWFLIGLALPVISVSCQALTTVANRALSNKDSNARRTEGDPNASDAIQVRRDSKTLVMATSANYPPYEQRDGDAKDADIVGFDIDLATLIAERMGRQLTVVDVDFSGLLPAVINDEVDIAMAALEPTRSRKQRVEFSDIYYRSRHALISLDGYLRSRDLNYQIIGLRKGSVQARYGERLNAEYPDLDIAGYDTLEEVFEALDIGAVEGAILEATVATTYLRRYPDFQAQVMPSDRATGSAIALPKDSPLRREVNAAINDIKASGEMARLIAQWFS